MAFVRRLISVTFALSPPATPGRLPGATTFAGSGGANQMKVDGLRISCQITKAGWPFMNEATLRIYGMTKSAMNELSTLGQRIQLISKSQILVQAGDEGSPLTTVFLGGVLTAYPDFDSQPQVFLQVEAKASLANAVISIPPTSFRGSADVATIMQGLASQMKRQFENSGVNKRISNPYLPGSAWDQAKAVAKAADINMVDDDGVLAIWPRNGARGDKIALISPRTGMIGSPSFSPNGIVLRVRFDRSLGLGFKFKVENDLLPAANGIWVPYGLDHSLDSMMPNGRWESTIQAYSFGTAPPIIK